ncbi:MAG: Uncharacterized MFS-type transporter YhjE, partial [uncultured Caballeronia sp.]
MLVALGLYVRLKIAETSAFREAIEKKERVWVPIATLFVPGVVSKRFFKAARISPPIAEEERY